MKKILKLTLASIITLASINSNAQFIIKAGTNLNHATTSKDGEMFSKAGWHAGLAYNIPIYKNINVETGLFYDTRGFKLHENNFEHQSEKISGIQEQNGMKIPYAFDTKFISTEEDTDVNLGAITLPVLLKVKFPVKEDYSFFVTAGPYMNLLVKGESNTTIKKPVIKEFNVDNPTDPTLIATLKNMIAAQSQGAFPNADAVPDALAFQTFSQMIQQAATPSLISQIEKGEVRDVLEEKGVNIWHLGMSAGLGFEFKKLVLSVNYERNFVDVTEYEPIKVHALKATVGFKL